MVFKHLNIFCFPLIKGIPQVPNQPSTNPILPIFFSKKIYMSLSPQVGFR